MVTASRVAVLSLAALVWCALACGAACSPFGTTPDAPLDESGTHEPSGGGDGGDAPDALDAARDVAAADADAAGADVDAAPLDPGPFVVFVTDTANLVGGDITPAGADVKCASAFNSVTLKNFSPSTKIVAWLSTLARPAASRVIGDGPWRLPQPDGTPGPLVASTKQALLSGVLTNAIGRNQRGEVYNINVWTGTAADGSFTTDTCAGWTNAASGRNGRVGLSSESNSQWTDNRSLDCSNVYALYCFQLP